MQSRETIETVGEPGYFSYLLRLWRTGAGDTATWRASLQSSPGSDPVGFASLDELFDFLRRQTGAARPEAPQTRRFSLRAIDERAATNTIIDRKGDYEMSLEEIKANIRWAGEEAWIRGNLDALDEVYDADYVFHRPPFPDTKGLEAVKQSIAGSRSAYSDIQATYDEWVGEGDTIAYRWTFRLKHTGQSPSLPIPPTGKEVTLVGCTVVHLKDGKVIEEFEYGDYLGFLQQLGVVPPLG